MILPYGFLLFGVVFFGVVAVVNFVRAYRKRERIYYLSGVISSVMVVVLVLVFFEQILLMFFLFLIAGVASLVTLPKMRKVVDRELEEVDTSSPLRTRDFLTYCGWFKLASKWGSVRVMCLYFLLSVAIIGGSLFALSISWRFMEVGVILVYTIVFSTIPTMLFYQQIKRALKSKMRAE